MRLVYWSFLFLWFLMDCWIDGWAFGRWLYRDAGKFINIFFVGTRALTMDRIVEYATREQAQQAVNTLSNQTLMGRLVYVREVRTSRPTQFFIC